MALIRAIAGRDGAAASRMLAASPDLARQALGVGASRQEASTYFLEVITHYVYAGDTALHVAAAAYQPGIAAELLASGADPRARNRRGAEHEKLPEAKAHLLYDEEIPALVIDDPQFAFFLAQAPMSAWMRLTGKRESPKRRLLFVSYSRSDAPWLERLRLHLRPLEREGLVKIWDDTSVLPGSKRNEDVARAIESARVAVLLVSAPYLASDFIIDHELPPLLAAAAVDGALICPLIVSPCRFVDVPSLAQFQPFNDPDVPLTSMGFNEQEKTLVEVSRVIEAALALSDGVDSGV